MSRVVLAGLLVAGCASQGLPGPAPALTAYAGAVQAGDAQGAYALLDTSTRGDLPFARFEALLRENQTELRQQAEEIRRLAGRGVVGQARVPLRSGEPVWLSLEGGRWVVTGGVLDASSLRTPRNAVLAFRQAMLRRSLPGILRVLARRTRAELESDMDQLAEETTDELDMDVEIVGNVARVRTTGGRELTLVREAGEWHILEVD